MITKSNGFTKALQMVTTRIEKLYNEDKKNK